MGASLGVEEVHEALLCLYSPTELARCALAQEIVAAREVGDVVLRAQAVRDLLLDALETLRPTGGPSPSASASRAYDCLTYRYVSGMSVEDVAYELHLSPRQVYRDLRWGEERLAELLSSRLSGQDAPDPRPSSPLSQELEAAASGAQAMDLAEAVASSVAALDALAERLDTTLEYEGPTTGLPIRGTPGLLRSLIAQVLSALLQTSGPVHVSLTSDHKLACLSFRVRQRPGILRRELAGPASQLLQVQRIDYRLSAEGEDAILQMHFPLNPERVVLVVEDSPGACALYGRYLEGTGWKPVLAERPGLVTGLAVAHRAAAIILDIMMPETDGWSVLQAVRLNPLTAEVPVIVCSVLSDPELAAALGATGYLTKPVTRPQLLAALAQAAPASRPA